MTISSGLKEKNRIAGKIATLQKRVKQFNKHEKGQDQDFNSLETLKSLQEEWAYLIALKTRLAIANVGIAEKLIKLTEAKAELTFWNGFTSYDAGRAEEIEVENFRQGTEYVSKEKIIVSEITSKDVAGHQERVQKEIENLQDEIDAYNATTQI